MTVELKDHDRKLGGGRVTYVVADGVRYAIPRADDYESMIEAARLLSSEPNAEALRGSLAYVDKKFGSGNAPVPGRKTLPVPLGDAFKGSEKFYAVKAFKLALNPDHLAYQAALHRVAHYPADQVTFTADSRKKLRPSIGTHSKKTGRGKVGVGGIRTKSHG